MSRPGTESVDPHAVEVAVGVGIDDVFVVGQKEGCAWIVACAQVMNVDAEVGLNGDEFDVVV